MDEEDSEKDPPVTSKIQNQMKGTRMPPLRPLTPEPEADPVF